jgi:Transposase
VGQLAKLGVAPLGGIERRGEQRLRALPVLAQRSLREVQSDDRMEQALLDSVVEVAYDPPARVVACGEHAGAGWHELIAAVGVRDCCVDQYGTPMSARTPPAGRWGQEPECQTVGQLATASGEVQQANTRLYRAFLLAKSCGCSTTSTTRAWRPRISTPGSPLHPSSGSPAPFASTAEALLAAIRLGLSNGSLEGLNSKIRLISYRSFGFHSADALIALVYLCCTSIDITLPR